MSPPRAGCAGRRGWPRRTARNQPAAGSAGGRLGNAVCSPKTMPCTGCAWPTGTGCGPGPAARTSRACGGGRTWPSSSPRPASPGCRRRCSPGLTRPPARAGGRCPFPTGPPTRFGPTADGGLAIRTGVGLLEVVDLATGRVRWSRPGGPDGPASDTAIATAGDALLVSVDGQLSSYDDRTGQAAVDRFAAERPGGTRPGQPAGVSRAGLRDPGAAEHHRSARPGAARHQRGERPGEMAVRAPHAGIARCLRPRADVRHRRRPCRQDEFNPATGRVRWQVASTYRAVATPAGIVIGPDHGRRTRQQRIGNVQPDHPA